jgi:hypothetical protein
MWKSSELTLVDACVLIESARVDRLQPLLQRTKIAVGRLSFSEVRHFEDDARNRHPIEVGRFPELVVLDATSEDLAELTARWERRRLSPADKEFLALAWSKGLIACTSDVRVMKALWHLGLLDHWVSLEELLAFDDMPAVSVEPQFRKGLIDDPRVKR